jgi:FKBP-type peptidyl-prolyl cis-trans isomerase
MYRKLLGALCLGGGLLAGCGTSDSGITESGINYTFQRNADSEALDSGTIIAVNMRQLLIKDADTIIDRSTSSPMPITVGSKEDPLMEVINLLTKGDSVSVNCLAENFFPKGQPLPPSVPAGSTICYEIGIVETFANQEGFMEYARKLEEARMEAQYVVIEQYAASQGLTLQKTESGLYYAVTEEGKGELAKPGDQLEVHYHGTLLDGTKFDSSVERNETFNFPVGQRQVITAWDEGFQLLKEGSKGVFIVPAHLAYGRREMGPVIKPYSILRFDVQFIKNNGQPAPHDESGSHEGHNH